MKTLSVVTVAISFLVCAPVLAESLNQETATPKTEASMDKVAPVKAAKRFDVSLDKTFYEFKGVNPANQSDANGNSAYEFDRVTYDTNTLTMKYLAAPDLQYSVVTGYNAIYAETKVYGFLSVDETKGLSDTTLKVTKSWFKSSGIYVTELGTSLPTGSIQEKNTSSPVEGDNYPYNMQLGSGTNDFVLNSTYIKPLGNHQVGAFGMATVRTGKNSQGYRKGDEFIARTWYSYAFNQYVSPGIWLNYMNIQGVNGRERTLDNPVLDDILRFYYNPRSFWDVTANATAQYPINETLKLKGLLGLPVAQHSWNVDDIQLHTQWFAQAGVQGQF